MPTRPKQDSFYPFTAPKGDRIELPRVTSILRRVVNKPELVDWAYWRTIDSISGLATEGGKELSDVTFREMIMDSMTLNEWLTINSMRPEDWRDERASQGDEAHDALATLAAQQLEGIDLDTSLAQTVYETHQSPYVRAVADWWKHRNADVQASEKLLWSLENGGYAGTCDLIADWVHAQYSLPRRHIVDLKTRKDKNQVYNTDMWQIGMYQYAYSEMELDGLPMGIVLIVDVNGEWAEHEVDFKWQDGVPHLLGVDKVLREGRR